MDVRCSTVEVVEPKFDSVDARGKPGLGDNGPCEDTGAHAVGNGDQKTFGQRFGHGCRLHENF
jgi:hypothetical protein